jgi:hypothetical protein
MSNSQALSVESGDEVAPLDDRSPEEKAAGVAKMRAWLDNLPPPLAKMYEDLKRLDPKGQPR